MNKADSGSCNGKGFGMFVVISKMTSLPFLSLKREKSNGGKLFKLFIYVRKDYRSHKVFILNCHKPHHEIKINSLAHFL